MTESKLLAVAKAIRQWMPRDVFLTEDHLTNMARAAVAALDSEREEGCEWFWRIVDAEGLADLPSDEEAALRLLVARGA